MEKEENKRHHPRHIRKKSRCTQETLTSIIYSLSLILTIAHRKFMFSTLALPRSDKRSAAQGHSLSPTSLSSRFTYFIASTVQHMGICDNPDKRKSSLT